MKNKKKVLTILLILIIIIASILIIVNFFGGMQAKKVEEYYKKIENAACKMASEEGYTKAICENFPNVCRIKYEKLINYDYLDKDLVNPIDGKKVEENTKNYVEVIWKDNKMVCKHREG